MKQIPLTQGKFALVDDDDFEEISKHRWYAVLKGGHYWYAGRQIGPHGRQQKIYMHSVIANAPLGMPVDHIDGNGLNNSKSNLRVCTYAENGQNRGKSSINTSGYKGVTKSGKGWQAQIESSGKGYYLGRFDTPEEAARAYDAAARELHGEFARTNFSD